MKKLIFVLSSLVIVAACFSIAVIEYNNHKTTVAASRTSQVQTALNTLKLHDAVNAKTTAELQTQFKTDQATLCQFINQHTVKGVVVPSECTASPL